MMQLEIGEKPVSNKNQQSLLESSLSTKLPIFAYRLKQLLDLNGADPSVRIKAVAGDNWGVSFSPNNKTDVPNILIYPRDCLSLDKNFCKRFI
jgi:hypothetical protein